MREPAEREIDGHSWTVTPFSATTGLKHMISLSKIFGGPIGKAVASLQGKDMGDLEVSDLSFQVIGQAIGELADRLDEETTTSLIMKLFEHVRMDGKAVVSDGTSKGFNLAFASNYGTMFKVLSFVIEVNYQVPLASLVAEAFSRDTESESTPGPS